MKRTMLMGENGSGKEALISLLLDAPTQIRRTMAVEYYDFIINTPSEFLENKFFFNALITASVDCEILLMIVSDQHRTSLFPPNFAPLFNKTVIGIITQSDDSSGNQKRAELFLHNTGVLDILTVNIKTGQGMDTLKERLI